MQTSTSVTVSDLALDTVGDIPEAGSSWSEPASPLVCFLVLTVFVLFHFSSLRRRSRGKHLNFAVRTGNAHVNTKNLYHNSSSRSLLFWNHSPTKREREKVV